MPPHAAPIELVPSSLVDQCLQAALQPPKVHGDPQGELLVVGWGSTLGAIEEAVDRLRSEGLRVSSLHLRFLSPFEPGLKEIFSRFRKVLTVEVNYSDDPGDPGVGLANLVQVGEAERVGGTRDLDDDDLHQLGVVPVGVDDERGDGVQLVPR